MEKGSLTGVHTARLQEHREYVSAEVGSWSGCPKPFQGECQSTFSFPKSEAEHAAMHLLSVPNSEVGTQINVSAPPQPGECPPGTWFDVFALLFLWLHSPFLFLEHIGWFAGHFCKLMHGGHYAELHYFLDSCPACLTVIMSPKFSGVWLSVPLRVTPELPHAPATCSPYSHSLTLSPVTSSAMVFC